MKSKKIIESHLFDIERREKARLAEAIMGHTSNALLKLEWDGSGFCRLCSNAKPTHAIGCDVDLALAERGFTTTRNRDAARECLKLSDSHKDTIPAPPDDKVDG